MNMNINSITSELPTDMLSSTFLLGEVGAPFVIGLAAGYFAKKMLRLALFIGGAAIVLVLVANNYGIAHVSTDSLQNAATAATAAAQQSGGFLMGHLSNITSKGASASAGFFLGLKFG
ncbi:FUN14 domain-containing protein [Candidatus Methylospira mobilis]|nr:FUN14 domain-containing protein [Candidatus Methylospira mobilis]WNV03346.1 FUN14 domain-containing protein [Candidatus Methylospira mobilis]